MKNSIKILSLLLLALFANVSSGANANYTYNSAWYNASNTLISTPTLVNTDSVTVIAGTWNLSSGTSTVKGVNLQGGTLALVNRTLNGRVHNSGSSSITNSGGSINGTLTTTGGTLTIGDDLSASRINLKGGTVALMSNDLNGPVNVLLSSSISATNSNASIDALTIRTSTLSISGSNFSVSSLNMAGGNLNLATYTLTASGNVTISANGTISSNGSGVFYTSNETTVNGGTLTIDHAEFVTDDLTFSSSNHIITTNNGLMSFDNSDNDISGSSAVRHINGTIRVYIDNGSKSTRTYPLGDGSVYAPVRLEIPSSNSSLSNVSGGYGTHFVTLSYFGTKNSNTADDNTIVSASGHEYWSIITSSTNPIVKITLYLNTTGSNYGKTVASSPSSSALASDIKIAQFNSSSSQWTMLPAGVGSTTNGGVPVTSTTTFSPKTFFTFGSVDSRTTFFTPLPVSIIDFSASVRDKNIDVTWSTDSEKDNAEFVVEKSLDGQTWLAIGSVKGAKTSNVVNNYGLVDNNAVAGIQYYRLKQIDLDGAVSYGKAIAVNFSKASTLNVSLFPNPAKDVLNITTENNASGEVSIQILNSMGEMVYNQVAEAGLVQNIDIASFIPGVYYVSVIAEGQSKIIRLLKN